ncbi:MAG: phosphatase PAP2 family protein, partial [Deltaproteobacteria bacterium]|nr:phosphatase PAP2 family protein [Deltaproteobacteria bacterium]
PFVAALDANAQSTTSQRSDYNLSFYSGHTNLAFSLVVSAGTVAHLRGYRAEPFIWGVGLPLATFVAYSRLGAQKHYLSDVVVGSLTGAAVGFLIPFLHRSQTATLAASGSQLTVAPAPNGLSLAGTF